MKRALSITESIRNLLNLFEFNLGDLGINLDQLSKDSGDTETDNATDSGSDDQTAEPDDSGTSQDVPDQEPDTDADQKADTKTSKKPRKVFHNTKLIVDEIIRGYQHRDFKEVIDSVSKKYGLPPLRLVRLFMKRTGTLASELPDGYHYGEFVPPKPSGDEEGASQGGGDESGGYG